MTNSGISPSDERRTRRGRRLTDRQAEILEMVSEGLENKEIGRRLGLTEQAVKEHVSALLKRLDVRNRAGLADAAASLRMVGSTEVSSEWMHLLFRHAPLFVALLEGPTHRFVAVNEAYRKASGPRGELIGKTFRDAYPDLDEAGIVKLLDASFESGEARSAAAVPARWYRGPNGEFAEGYLTTFVEPMRRDDGTVGGVVMFGLDVTTEIEARGAARELEDERHIALDQLPSGVITIRKDGTITEINAAGREILGLDADLVGSSVWGTFLFVDERGQPLPEKRRPLGRALQGERVPVTTYRGCTSRNKALLSLRVSAAPLFGSDGTVRGAVAVFTPSGAE